MKTIEMTKFEHHLNMINEYGSMSKLKKYIAHLSEDTDLSGGELELVDFCTLKCERCGNLWSGDLDANLDAFTAFGVSPPAERMHKNNKKCFRCGSMDVEIDSCELPFYYSFENVVKYFLYSVDVLLHSEFFDVTLECASCGATWELHEGCTVDNLTEEFWKCPNGCNWNNPNGYK